MNNKSKPFMVLQFCMIRTLLLFLVLIGFAFQFTISPALADKSATEILAGVHRNYPPQYFTDEKTGKPSGFAIDTMDEIARRAGLKINYLVFNDWTQINSALKEGRIDIIPNIGISKDRTADMDFTIPIETVNIRIFIRSTTTDIQNIESLQGRKVAVVTFNIGTSIIQSYGKALPVIFKSLDEALLSLLSGNTDALIYPEPSVLLVARRSKIEARIITVGEPLLEIKRAIAVGNGKIELLTILDKAVTSFIATPEYAKIYTKWYGAPEPYWNVRNVLITSGTLLALIIIVFTALHYLSLVRLNIHLQNTIQKQKESEEALRESEERYRTLVENASDIVFRLDDTGHITFVNPAALRITGYEEKDIIGRHYPTFIRPDMQEEAIKFFGRQFMKGIPNTYSEYPVIVKDGREIWLGQNTQLIFQEGKVAAFQAVARDITERKQAEADKEKLEAQNRQLQKTKSLRQMAGAIAHHFNNQLGVVIGNLEMAIDELPQGVGAVKSLNKAMQAAGKAAELSNLMLTYLGQSFDKREPIDFSDVCRMDLPILQAVIPVKMILKTDLPTPGPVITANSSQIKQILNNLVTNAWESVGEHEGIIHLTVKTIPREEIPDVNRFPVDWQPQDTFYACLDVTDTGGGIAPKDIEGLFDPFFSDKFTGRGMGLPVVLGILRSHNGAVTVESEPGRGSTFRVFLPVFPEEGPGHGR
jgi:PAS domain S-box-containing protein